ncbi:MAG: LytR/AlgR family response regulator transcription factor [Enterocloster clostridioformis]
MKIAVIDDERPARKELVHQIMEAMPDSQIEEADSGASAIELISRRTFDLLFVDISLGDMEGTTLAAAARRILPDAQIVFATAYSRYGVKAFELGVNNYILKPFDPGPCAPTGVGKSPKGPAKTRLLPLLILIL